MDLYDEIVELIVEGGRDMQESLVKLFARAGFLFGGVTMFITHNIPMAFGVGILSGLIIPVSILIYAIKSAE